MKAQALKLSTSEQQKLQLLVEGLNLVHNITVDDGEPLCIRVDDIFIRERHEGIFEEQEASHLLSITPEVLNEGYVRALHICFEQLKRPNTHEDEYYNATEQYIPPVVQYVLDHAREFKKLITQWGA